jgi:hypothetical protein
VLWMSTAAALPFWAITFGGVAIGGAIYALAMAAFRVPEMYQLYSALQRRLAWLPEVQPSRPRRRSDELRRKRK